MAKSTRTKKFKRGYIACLIIEILLFVVPALLFFGTGFIMAPGPNQQIALTATALVALILTAVGVVNKVAFRSVIWVLLIGLVIVLPEVELPILVIGGAQIADELIVSNIKDYYKKRYIINKEIDKRED